MLRSILRSGLFLGALWLPWTGLAAGLGKLTVQSALGDPLKAEIEIVAARSDELASLQTRIAPPSAYKQANIEYQPALAGVRAKIETRAGRPVVVLTSTQPIHEPFLNVLVELTWDGGTVLREYTFLLDPPADVALKPAVPEVKGAEAKAVESPSALVPAPPSAPAPQAAARPKAVPETYGPVKPGDTLSQIAERTRPSGASLEQMLVALFRSNPDAFMGNNMNRLKAGPVLRIPAREEVMAIEQKEAVSEFRAHVANWKAYREQLAGAAAAAEPAAAGGQVAAGKVTAAVEEKGPAADQPKEVLKLSKAEAAGGAQTLQERIRALEEESIAREKALKEAQERVAVLEQNIRDMQKLLELRGLPIAPAPSRPAETETAKPASESAAGEATVETKPEATAAPPPPAPAPQPPKAEAAPKPASKPDAPPPAPSFMDTLLEEPLYLAGAGGVIVLLLGWVMYAQRRKQAAGAGETPTVSEAEASTASIETASQSAASTPSPETTAMGPGPIEEVDPLQEAEVYLTYRRDVQAEEVLKEALAKTPGRPELHLKLLEIYRMRQDKVQFEETARRLKAIAEGTPHWEKAVAMGLALDPTNPLYGGKPAAAPVSDEVLDVASPPAEESQSSGIDFDLSFERKEEAAQAEELAQWRTPSSIDTSTVDFEITPAVTEDRRDGMKAGRDGDESLSVNFELPPLEQSRTTDRPGTQESTTKLDFDFSLDLGEQAPPEASGGIKDAHWQEVATKFDLAKAYKEMGDKEGAREILQEVLREGDEQQKRDAQALLDSL